MHIKNTRKKYYLTLPLVFLLLSASGKGATFSEFKRSESLMDTDFTITIYSYHPGEAEDAAKQAFSEIKKIESMLNIHDNSSEISKLNRQKIINSPSNYISTNIERSLYYSKLTDGAFDITVQPILDLYKKAFSGTKSPPSDKMIREELKKVGYKKIILTDGGIRIGDDQSITLGGLAKGYAVEKAVGILKKRGISMALVNAGGNMRALGKKPSGEWNIALRDPRNEDNYITIIPLDNNAVSTSGDYERYFNETRTFHHIINPKTGYSATELISVTIITDNAFDGDALSTSVFVLGKEKGMQLIESLPGVEGLIITRKREIFRSSGFKEKEIRKH